MQRWVDMTVSQSQNLLGDKADHSLCADADRWRKESDL